MFSLSRAIYRQEKEAGPTVAVKPSAPCYLHLNECSQHTRSTHHSAKNCSACWVGIKPSMAYMYLVVRLFHFLSEFHETSTWIQIQ